MKKVNILGTEYSVIMKKYDEDEAFARRSICGYCDALTKKIVLCDVATYKGWEHEPEETVIGQNMQTLRHEIVHAFLYESGLEDSTFAYDGGWAKNEEMVDWIANQGPKIFAAWENAGAVAHLPGTGVVTFNLPTTMDPDELAKMLDRNNHCQVLTAEEVIGMTKEAAIHQFFTSFGIPGYRSTAVPHDAVLPYLTYTPVIASFGDDPVSVTVQLYFRTTSEAVPDAKAEELRQRIGPGGILLPCEGGRIWLRWGSPWCQSFLDETDKTIKRRYINVTADFLTL